jgi:hypothetical protein
MARNAEVVDEEALKIEIENNTLKIFFYLIFEGK